MPIPYSSGNVLSVQGYQKVTAWAQQSVTWVATCLLSTAIRGGGTVLQQIRSVHHQLFTILSSHWSSSLSRGWPRASSPPPSEAGEPYYSRSGQYITCLRYSLLIGLAVCYVGGLVPPLYHHQRQGNRTTADQVSTSRVYDTLFSLV
jgi:hypothetical protein